MFIVIEGIDGSGKTTLSECITSSLNQKGNKAVRYSEPTNYETGIFIRKFLAEEIHLSKREQIEAFIRDREFSVTKNILPSLSSGSIVILDRYYFSTAAYQASKEYTPEFILRLNTDKNFPKPDLVFYLDLIPELALERLTGRGKKKEIFETLQSLENIYHNFKKILPSDVLILDAKLNINDLLDVCLKYIFEKMILDK